MTGILILSTIFIGLLVTIICIALALLWVIFAALDLVEKSLTTDSHK